MAIKKSHKLFSLSMSTKKGSPNFKISPIPAFGGLLVANSVTVYNWGSGQFTQCTSKNFMVIFVGSPPERNMIDISGRKQTNFKYFNKK
jgi:hypothetical protein